MDKCERDTQQYNERLCQAVADAVVGQLVPAVRGMAQAATETVRVFAATFGRIAKQLTQPQLNYKETPVSNMAENKRRRRGVEAQAPELIALPLHWKICEYLVHGGITTRAQLATTTDEELLELDGIGEGTLQLLKPHLDSSIRECTHCHAGKHQTDMFEVRKHSVHVFLCSVACLRIWGGKI